MSDIKVVSFDFWNTLAIPNKAYAEARTEYLYSHYGIDKVEYNRVKWHLDRFAETNGMATTPMVAISMLFKGSDIIGVDLHQIEKDFNKLFLENPPLIDDKVKDAIHELESKDIQWGVISNTNFISGSVLRPFIESELPTFHLTTMIFSDIVGVSKPSKQIFTHFYSMSCYDMDCNNVERNQIMHIGDSEICDYNGAQEFGFRPQLIKDSNDILLAIRRL